MSPTNSEIADSFDLWQEHADPDATMSHAEWQAMRHAERVALLVEVFGPETEDEPVFWYAHGPGL